MQSLLETQSNIFIELWFRWCFRRIDNVYCFQHAVHKCTFHTMLAMHSVCMTNGPQIRGETFKMDFADFSLPFFFVHTAFFFLLAIDRK